MTPERNKQLFSLSDFFRAHWIPILESLASPCNDELEELFQFCKWIDAVGWITLGIDLQVYDHESAKNLLAGGRFKMRALYERHQNQLTEEFLIERWREFRN
jgi:hypothetical protein